MSRPTVTGRDSKGGGVWNRTLSESTLELGKPSSRGLGLVERERKEKREKEKERGIIEERERGASTTDGVGWAGAGWSTSNRGSLGGGG